VAALASSSVSIYFYTMPGETTDRAWWPVLATFGSVLLTSVVLFFGALIRFALFRNRTTNRAVKRRRTKRARDRWREITSKHG